MKEINIKDIIEINKDCIIYRDHKGEKSHIDLAVCAAQFQKQNPHIDASAHCVGLRRFPNDFCLYTPEETHLIVALKPLNAWQRCMEKLFSWNFHVKEFSAFYKVQKELNGCGWTTYDMT